MFIYRVIQKGGHKLKTYRVIQKGGHKLETYTLQDHQKKGFETLCIVDDTMDFASAASPKKNPEDLICLFSGLFCIYSCGQPTPVLSL